jgi:hypothetical protein
MKIALGVPGLIAWQILEGGLAGGVALRGAGRASSELTP